MIHYHTTLAVLTNYLPNDIYNMDKTELFYKLLQFKSLTLKVGRCTSGKLSKDRITILPSTNMNDTHKLPFFSLSFSSVVSAKSCGHAGAPPFLFCCYYWDSPVMCDNCNVNKGVWYLYLLAAMWFIWDFWLEEFWLERVWPALAWKILHWFCVGFSGS